MNVRQDWMRYSAPQKTVLVCLALSLAASLGFLMWVVGPVRFPVALFMVWWAGSILLLKDSIDKKLGLSEPLGLLMLTCLAASFSYTWNVVNATRWNWMTILVGALLIAFLAVAHKSSYLPSWRRYIEAHVLEHRARKSRERVSV